ncbi:POU domain class 2-associating factor 1 [Saguinus oedipus]|uniref:POU domain class 2-associating factor 1 n=1 Tax=Saguinus oedipus TaxID=9490 RepID=A0ABQ9UQU2_SAGOE|nr:POU domain class 2-associating factor 1 [Saguinus oedipus]
MVTSKAVVWSWTVFVSGQDSDHLPDTAATFQIQLPGYGLISSATPTVGPPLEGPEHQAPLTYFPWPQPLSTLPTSTLQYQPPAPALPGPQFVQLPISIPEPVLQEMEDPRRAASSLTIDKLLLEEEDSDAYALNHTLSVEGF